MGSPILVGPPGGRILFERIRINLISRCRAGREMRAIEQNMGRDMPFTRALQQKMQVQGRGRSRNMSWSLS
ncbi:hypothetical protein TIFTF001_006727 [Ficus carica]|uniref:Uncharacterized protein n=1 Tax=Ficus carica TaxID=3494 RepID=A0AA87ZNQ3_FICCA|nr:hypothetical protein TIFTF001_006727 [Ficus carica]